MKNLCLFVLVVFLYSCTKYEIEKVIPNEMGLDTNLSGKIFEIECKGSKLIKAKDINKFCRKTISEFAYEQGYEYFTVLNSNVDLQRLKVTTSVPVNTYYKNDGASANISTYIPQTNVYSSSSSAYLFILIEENEINNWKNYYRVSDYYTSVQKKEIPLATEPEQKVDRRVNRKVR